MAISCFLWLGISDPTDDDRAAGAPSRPWETLVDALAFGDAQ
jgi:hypothetical protein